jgi:DNA-binding beta-propeller fold protein YncE
VLRIHFDGSLSLLPDGVVSSGGTLPDSIAVHGNLVYVANSGNGGSNYTGFRLGFDGAVDARLSPDGRFLYVDESRIGAVGAFAVSGGSLTELATSPTSLPAGATPAGIVVS